MFDKREAVSIENPDVSGLVTVFANTKARFSCFRALLTVVPSFVCSLCSSARTITCREMGVFYVNKIEKI